MKYRARANGNVLDLSPAEAAVLVPGVYEPLGEDVARASVVRLEQEATEAVGAAATSPEAPKRRRRRK